MLSNTLRLNLLLAKIIRHILENKRKNKCEIHEIIWLIIMKMKMNMKDGSHRYDINKCRTRHGYKYSKNKKCFIMIMLICIKQHLRNILSSIHEKFKQHWEWVEKKPCLNKMCILNKNLVYCIEYQVYRPQEWYTWYNGRYTGFHNNLFLIILTTVPLIDVLNYLIDIPGISIDMPSISKQVTFMVFQSQIFSIYLVYRLKCLV